MNTNITQLLAEPFPREMEKILKKGGASLTYIPVSEVITRLNKVLGIDSWSFNILSCDRDSLDPEYIVAHVRLIWHTDPTRPESTVVRDGFGGQKIKRTKTGDIVDLGDEMKGAVSDALKKAAQTLGVGLYLARSEEAMDVEEAMSISPAEQGRLDKWEQFAGLAKALDAGQRTELNEFWEKHAGGRPKPTKSNATDKDLDDLIAEIVRIQFGATLVSE